MNLTQWLFPFGREPKEDGRFTNLLADAILKTIGKLEQRIAERFPESGLHGVCVEFHALATKSTALAHRLKSPIWPVRVAIFVAAGLLLGLVVWAINQLVQHFHFDAGGISEFMQATESAINELILLGLTFFFLLGLETRIKRRSILKALHRLRSIAHVVDMHQLTKDPAYLLSNAPLEATESSPKRSLTRHQLTRYLDYCAELLALNSKVAALFAQNTEDAEVLHAVSDLELLVQGLSAKIWQKIMILDLAAE